MRLRQTDTVVVVIDVQERLAAAMADAARERCVTNVGRLLEGARALELPVLCTEQYPKGLGPTVAHVRAALPPSTGPIEKTDFDACSQDEFVEALIATKRRTVVLAGMETHICVWQTARGLTERGYGVSVPVDATCSRKPEDYRIGESLLERSGAEVTCVEAVLFDLLANAKHPAFKEVSRIVR